MEFCRCLLYTCCIKKPKPKYYEDSEEEYEPQTINSKDYEQPSFLKEKLSSVYKMVSSISLPPSISSWSVLPKEEIRKRTLTLRELDSENLPKEEEVRKRTVTLRELDFENLVDRHI